MFEKLDVTALQLHKKTLVLESELNRLALRAECERLREAAGWLSLVKGARSQITPWARWPAWRWHSACAVQRRPADDFLSRALRLAPSLLKLWRAWMVATS